MANCETSKKRGLGHRRLPLMSALKLIQKQFRIRFDHCGKIFNTFCFYKYTSTGWFPLLGFKNDFSSYKDLLPIFLRNVAHSTTRRLGYSIVYIYVLTYRAISKFSVDFRPTIYNCSLKTTVRTCRTVRYVPAIRFYQTRRLSALPSIIVRLWSASTVQAFPSLCGTHISRVSYAVSWKQKSRRRHRPEKGRDAFSVVAIPPPRVIVPHTIETQRLGEYRQYPMRKHVYRQWIFYGFIRVQRSLMDHSDPSNRDARGQRNGQTRPASREPLF